MNKWALGHYGMVRVDAISYAVANDHASDVPTRLRVARPVARAHPAPLAHPLTRSPTPLQAFPLTLTSAHMSFSFIVLAPFAMRVPIDTHVRTLEKQWKGLVCIGGCS